MFKPNVTLRAWHCKENFICGKNLNRQILWTLNQLGGLFAKESRLRARTVLPEGVGLCINAKIQLLKINGTRRRTYGLIFASYIYAGIKDWGEN